MNPSERDKKLDQLINQAINRQRPQLDFDKWRKDHQKEIQIYKLQAGAGVRAPRQADVWRIIIKHRASKLAVAAGVIMVAVIGINYFDVPIDGTSVAWGEVLRKVEQIRTCIYRGHARIMPTDDKEYTMESEVFVSSEHGSRVDSYKGEKLLMTQYMLPAEKALISVAHEKKKYMRMLLTEEHVWKMRQQGGGDPREIVRQFLSGRYTELGRAVIDAVEVEGVETTDPNVYGGMVEDFVARLWVDVHTDLPVRLEMEVQMESEAGLKQMSMVMDGFQWDVELDLSMFEPNIPADYNELPPLQMPEMDEASAVQGLGVFAGITGGKYPSSLAGMKVMKEVMEAMKPSFPDDPNNKPSEGEREKMMAEAMQKVVKVQGACMFYAELVREGKDPAYYGDRVTAEDTDAVLMRWRISDDEYRVIFGDLTAENVTAERLAELEKALVE